MQSCAVCADQAKVAPFAGAWIEIMLFRCRQILVIVAPFAGAWIEIAGNGSDVVRPRSLPSRERGLKYFYYSTCDIPPAVAPFAGAWIEILNYYLAIDGTCVAPFAGAWIEICAVMAG